MTNRLEVQALAEATGNYDEDEIETILDIYDDVIAHVGFEDKRKDKRYIVKFHDIFYYTPEEFIIYEDKEGQCIFEMLFDAFCDEQADYINMTNIQNNIDIDKMLTIRTVGHYQAFEVYISEITEQNAAELAMNIFDEMDYSGTNYASDYVEVVNTLQQIEDSYMDEWIHFIGCYEGVDKKWVNATRNKYERDKERRNAK